MNKIEIQALLLKYRHGKCTDEEKAQIHKWYDSLNSKSQLSLDDQERHLLENKLLQNIRKEIKEPELTTPNVFWTNRLWKSYSLYVGIAAALLLSLSYLYFFSKEKSGRIMEAESIVIHAAGHKLITITNEAKSSKKVILEDKSIVVLSPGSRIVYPDQFANDKREVQLMGDAYFEVTKNPLKPFCVYSGKLTTRVLGTSFRIKTNTGDKALEVEVVTGKVSVFENKDAFARKDISRFAHNPNNGVVLTPNQKVTYFAESGHLMTSLVEKPLAIAGTAVASGMVFNNEIMSNIIAQLQSEFGIEIVLDNDHLEKCTFTGDVSDMSLYDKLDLICKSNSATYEVRGTRILISGEGCI